MITDCILQQGVDLVQVILKNFFKKHMSIFLFSQSQNANYFLYKTEKIIPKKLKQLNFNETIAMMNVLVK